MPDPAFGGYAVVSSSSYCEEGSDRLGTIHVVKDSTARRAAEENYRLLFQEVNEGVFISTPEGRIIDCNEAFVRMLGVDDQEISASEFAKLWPAAKKAVPGWSVRYFLQEATSIFLAKPMTRKKPWPDEHAYPFQSL